jgi:hypothetical protein
VHYSQSGAPLLFDIYMPTGVYKNRKNVGYWLGKKRSPEDIA